MLKNLQGIQSLLKLKSTINDNKNVIIIVKLNKKVQWFIEGTQWLNFKHVGILYKQERYGERKVSLWYNLEYLNTCRVQERIFKHSHEIRVEGGSKGGLESSTG
jgi:hypothetical protein